MFNWLKQIFQKPVKPTKEFGGFEIDDGIVIGPSFFSQDGKEPDALLCPPVWAFRFGITNSLNRLTDLNPSQEQFQTMFNSLLDELVAEVTIYFQNRLKIWQVTDKLPRKMNSIPECLKSFKYAGQDIRPLFDAKFFEEIDVARGHRHHTFKRYFADYRIGQEDFDSVKKLRELTQSVRQQILELDAKLRGIKSDYEIRIQKFPNRSCVTWTASHHAFDMTNGAKLVPAKQTTGLDRTNLKYFSVEVNRRPS